MSITSGIVSIEDGVKAAEEFAPARKVRVELHFDIPEGGNEQQELDRVAALADASVNEKLGRKAKVASGPSAPRTPEVAAADAALAAQQPPAGQKLRAPRTRKPAEEPKADAPKELSDKEKLAKEAGVLVEQTDLEDAILNAPEQKPAATDDDLLSAPAPEITDQALVDAIMKRNGELKAEGCTTSNVKIREVIGSFNPDASRPQFTAKEIKQEHRADFLAKLKALKAT